MCRSVNSGDAFILINLEQPQHFVWFGRHSNSLEHSTAINLATTLCAGAELLQLHDAEDDERFWELLGGIRNSQAMPASSSDSPEVFDCPLLALTLKLAVLGTAVYCYILFWCFLNR